MSLSIHVAHGNQGKMHIDVMHSNGEGLRKMFYKEKEISRKKDSRREECKERSRWADQQGQRMVYLLKKTNKTWSEINPFWFLKVIMKCKLSNEGQLLSITVIADSVWLTATACLLMEGCSFKQILITVFIYYSIHCKNYFLNLNFM